MSPDSPGVADVIARHVSSRLSGLPGADAVRRSPRLRLLLARKLGVRGTNPRPVAPLAPVGAKLELTYSCNLRCAFCYTDSPRHTLERSTDLSDDAWRAVVDDVLQLGVIEGVITGGEPLLRRELALELAERLDAGGVAICFNTNGWFVDEAVADRLAALPLLSVNISLDGATPEIHDRARGVPGSWRRVVRAIALLRERGVVVRVTHVVTPDNEQGVGDLIAQVWTLGVSVVRIVTVVGIGGASRGGQWQVRTGPLRRVIAQARERFGPELDIRLEQEALPGGPVAAPAYLVVRPNGAVMAGTLSPFRFGDATKEGLARCWEEIRRDWDHPGVRAWRDPIARGGAVADAPVVPYRDEEIEVTGTLPQPGASPAAAKLPIAAASTQIPGAGDLDSAAEHVRALALARRYRPGTVRYSAGEAGGRYVRAPGGISRLNATAATVMDACSPGTPADAVAVLAARHPGRSLRTLEHEVLETTRQLARRGVLGALREGPDRPPAPAVAAPAPHL